MKTTIHYIGRAQIAGFIFFLLVWTVTKSRSETPENSSKGIANLAECFGIDIILDKYEFPVRTTHGLIAGAKASSAALQSYSRLFEQELGLYPKDLIRKAKLKRVVFCAQLAFDGQKRNAVPDLEHDTLYLEVERGNHDSTYMRKVIHHDFFHMIDYNDDGALYRDSGWAKLNPEKFEYGSGGKYAQTIPSTSQLTTAFPGFLNHYSTTGVEEDKAEVFANMMVESAYLSIRIGKDRVLAAKVKAMKNLVSKICPEIDDKFWADTLPTNRLAQSKGSTIR